MTAAMVLLMALSLFVLIQAYLISGFSSISSAGTFPMVAAAIMVVAMALTLLMTHEGWLPYDMAAAMVLGQNIGTTITAQIIAFKITEYSLLLVATGFFLQAFTKREQLKAVGTSLFIITLIGFLMGLIMSFQSAVSLQRFGGEIFVPRPWPLPGRPWCCRCCWKWSE